MMSTAELYKEVVQEYGQRFVYQVDLTRKFHITLEEAGYVTRSIGYLRGGRGKKLTKAAVFGRDPEIQRIAEKAYI